MRFSLKKKSVVTQLDREFCGFAFFPSSSDAIYSALYDGTGVIEILRGHEYLSHPFAVSLFGGSVYWTDWRTNTLARANKWTGANVTVIQKTSAQPFDLQIFHPSRQPQGRRSSMCLPNPPTKCFLIFWFVVMVCSRCLVHHPRDLLLPSLFDESCGQPH